MIEGSYLAFDPRSGCTSWEADAPGYATHERGRACVEAVRYCAITDVAVPQRPCQGCVVGWPCRKPKLHGASAAW